jgi:hypothetical protein
MHKVTTAAAMIAVGFGFLGGLPSSARAPSLSLPTTRSYSTVSCVGHLRLTHRHT